MNVNCMNLAAEPPDGKSSRAGQPGTKGPETAGAGTTGAGTVGAGNVFATPRSSSGTDQASFSFDQSRVQSLAAQVLAQPEIRQAKIQSLQQAIGNSEYAVSPGQVADALSSELGSMRA